METKQVINFYDEFVNHQTDSGVNDRIYGVYKRLLKLGLNSKSSILELGCGIGTNTYLFSKTITNGQIEAVDISPDSIAYCKFKIKKQNIKFFAGDIVAYKPQINNINFITLIDVIEHIPMEQHLALFKNIATYINDETRLVINIPNPEDVVYDINHNPSALQIIDQPVPLAFIIENLNKCGLQLHFFENYSVWVKNDYQFFVVKKQIPFTQTKLSDSRNFLSKLLKKIFRIYLKIRFKY